MIVYKTKDRVLHISEKLYISIIISRILPLLAKTKITPNMITIFNMFVSLVVYYCCIQGNLILGAILIQVYTLLDILDGNLARYKKMSTALGAKLDIISDIIFYNVIYIVVGYGRVPLVLIIITLILANLYSIIPTYYLVPRLRKLKEIKRFGLKKLLLEKKCLIGMDSGTAGMIISIFLLIGEIKVMFIVTCFLYIYDLLYRVIELKINEKINLE